MLASLSIARKKRGRMFSSFCRALTRWFLDPLFVVVMAPSMLRLAHPFAGGGAFLTGAGERSRRYVRGPERRHSYGGSFEVRRQAVGAEACKSHVR